MPSNFNTYRGTRTAFMAGYIGALARALFVNPNSLAPEILALIEEDCLRRIEEALAIGLALEACEYAGAHFFDARQTGALPDYPPMYVARTGAMWHLQEAKQ